MSIFKSLFVDCSEAAHCCDKVQYEEASFFEKLKIHLHLIICKPCKKYSNNNIKLTSLIKKADLKTCTEEEKKAWKEKIEKEISKKES
ncbi:MULTISPECIES: hypothetical protein [Antarcticibacterium]|nr:MULTISPECIES: hypothetical protein [Antarcticibacterium]